MGAILKIQSLPVVPRAEQDEAGSEQASSRGQSEPGEDAAEDGEELQPAQKQDQLVV